jgi:nitrate reductase NapAB chaperone NapD
MIKVIGIKIIDRIKEAGLTQAILSRYSGIITTRLGFHEVTDAVCSREAYIILHLNGNKEDSEKLVDELESLGGIIVKEMVFSDKDTDVKIKPPEGITEILGLLVERNAEVILKVQKLLTAYGCNIRTRLGVNELFFGEPAGLIILEMKGDQQQRLLLKRDLSKLNRVHVRSMEF